MAWLNAFLDKLTNKFHMLIGTCYGGALAVYYFKTHNDLGPGFVNATYAFYAFLAGHALTYQKWPDQDKPTVAPDANLPVPDLRKL